MASKEAEKIAEKLNAQVPSSGSTAFYSVMVDIVVAKATRVYEEYEKGTDNPLDEYGDEQGFLEELESKKDIIFARLQNQVRVLIRVSSRGKLTSAQAEHFIEDLERETWNFIYEKYAKPKSPF